MNKLYSLVSSCLKDEEGLIHAGILLNRKHPVFDGHFPGNPILPGVCTVQIAKEILEQAIQKTLMLSKASGIKYLGFVNPASTPEMQFELSFKHAESGALICSVTVNAGGNSICSFKGEYVQI
jgi:3-hydroxyacyl-[acyl-carrier-protein] dehydratase